MAFSDLANNQGVSFNSLNSGVSQGYFTAKTGIPSSTQMTTKSDCDTYVNVDTTYLPYAEKASNQVIVKEDLRSNTSNIFITNNFFTGTITDVTVNGVSITGASFPLSVGSGTSGYTNQIGTYDILVYYADADNPSNYMRIQDSAYNNSCVDGFSSLGPGPYYVYFPSQVINPNGVTIESGDGSCVGPFPFSDSPFNAVSVSRSSGQYMLAGISKFSSSGYLNGPLYVSSNYGSSWTFAPIIGYWYKVSISDNGQYMLAVEQYGKAYTSSNYGASWSEISFGINPYRGAALSGNGQYQMVLINSATVTAQARISTNYGASWSTVTFGSYNVTSCAIDNSGANFYIGAGGGSPVVLKSTNQGSSWSVVYSTSNLFAFVSDVNCTADGSKIVAPTFGNVAPLLKSNNYGSSWVSTGTSASWRSASVNTNIPVPLSIPTAYAVSEGSNFGPSAVTYLQKSEGTSAHTNTSAGYRNWRCVSNSDNGQYVLAGAYNGLYLSTNYGSSFTSL